MHYYPVLYLVDVTDRFDRVFWFGDFNFRVKKPRENVDRIMKKYSRNQDIVIRDLLQHDQLNEIFQKGKIFHGFTESPINFMPTYKFDVNTDNYDTSSKQRVPSWTVIYVQFGI
jgi:Phosphatidylinositol 5-phosphate phosphatase